MSAADLGALVGGGLNDRQIAALLGVSQPSVKRWRLRSGLRRAPAASPPWTSRDDERLVELFRAGLSDAKIAVKLGRPAPTSIQDRRRKLGLLRAEERPWSEADNEAMRELWESGATTREIAVALDRSPGAITQRRRRLGLAPRS